MKEIAGVLLIGLVVLAFLMRWDIEANHTQNSLGWDVHFKLDRWTGKSYRCVSGSGIPTECN